MADVITADSLLARLHVLADRVPFDLALRPGAAPGAPAGLPMPLPAAERELLGKLGGFAVPPVEFVLTGHPRQGSGQGLPERRWVVSDDGGGGLTWVDVAADGGWGQVLMRYREGGLYVQAGSLAEWLDRLVTTAEELVDDTGFDEGVQPYADDFWDALYPDGPDLPLPVAAALRAADADPVVAELAHRVPDAAPVADLRGAPPGSRARFDRVCGPYRLERAAGGAVFAAVPRED
ncbi:hypothetical protein GCM10010505_38180 [Kitasatospora aburaviensis]